MNKLIHQLRAALAKDEEAVPLDSFRSVARMGKQAGVQGSRRLSALAELLQERRDRGAAVLYLEQFIIETRRQVGADQSLFTTFSEREIPGPVLYALPPHTRAALNQLAELARKTPIPAWDALLFAHGLTIDGELCRLIAELSGEPEKPKPTGMVEARRQLAQLHPDKGGDPKAFAAASAMYRALK